MPNGTKVERLVPCFEVQSENHLLLQKLGVRALTRDFQVSYIWNRLIDDRIRDIFE